MSYLTLRPSQQPARCQTAAQAEELARESRVAYVITASGKVLCPRCGEGGQMLRDRIDCGRLGIPFEEGTALRVDSCQRTGRPRCSVCSGIGLLEPRLALRGIVDLFQMIADPPWDSAWADWGPYTELPSLDPTRTAPNTVERLKTAINDRTEDIRRHHSSS